MNPEMLDGIESVEIEENERLRVIVVAGSQGSKKIFESLLSIIPELPEIDFDIILGTMENPELEMRLSDMANVTTYGFITPQELARLYSQADIAITRGSSMLWELYYF